MRSIRKNFPAIVGWFVCLIVAYVLYYLFWLGVYLLRKSFPFEPNPIFQILFVVCFNLIAGYVGFVLSIRWIVFPLASFTKIPISKPKSWHLFSEWFPFYLTVLLFCLPLIFLNDLRGFLPISEFVMELINFGWRAIVSLFIYHDVITSDFYIKEASSQTDQSDLIQPPVVGSRPTAQG